jgi:hypothetical protein
LAKLFSESFQQWHARQQRALQRSPAEDFGARLAAAEANVARVEEAERALSALDREIQALRATKTFRYTTCLRELYGRLRRA